MPKLSAHHSGDYVKMLLIGDSGSGKTGALASLANAGYKLRIIDFDNGLDVLPHYVKPEAIDNVVYRTLTDKMKRAGNRAIPDGKPKAFTDALNLMTHWKYKEDGEDIDLGKPEAWGDDTILVIDSLTFMSEAAFRDILNLNGRLLEKPYQSDWGEAQDRVKNVLQLLFSNEMKTNVIVTAHVAIIEPEGGSAKGYPMTLGKALSPTVGRYFNTMLMAKTKGKGATSSRVIRTASEGITELKCPVPNIGLELPLETGLVDVFNAIRKKGV